MTEIKMTSEQKFGLMKQPVPTCPLIDEIMQEINDNNPELFDKLADKFEHIRNNCILIREWGQEWKSLAKSFNEEIEYSQNITNYKAVELIKLCTISKVDLVARNNYHNYSEIKLLFQLPEAFCDSNYCRISFRTYDSVIFNVCSVELFKRPLNWELIYSSITAPSQVETQLKTYFQELIDKVKDLINER